MRGKRKAIGSILFFIAIIVSIAGIKANYNEYEVSEEEKKTNELLVSMENKDANEINNIIQNAQSYNQYSDEESAVRIRFRNAVLIGDSVTEGMDAYNVLDKRNVYYKRGLRIDNCKEYIDSALKRNPNIVFLQFGMNDLEYHIANVDRFIEEYKKQIAYIRSVNKDCKIYVNSIIPIASFAINETPAYAYYRDYNNALKVMCNEIGCTYIDNEPAFAKVNYQHEFDGVHPCPQYYMHWAKNMILKAGL